MCMVLKLNKRNSQRKFYVPQFSLRASVEVGRYGSQFSVNRDDAARADE
jgi:hypothetical protein